VLSNNMLHVACACNEYTVGDRLLLQVGVREMHRALHAMLLLDPLRLLHCHWRRSLLLRERIKTPRVLLVLIV
jgi:hypothetical protein